MARKLAIAMMLAGSAWFGAQVLHACGDKFLIIGSGPAGPRLYASIHPATILVIRRGTDLAIDSPFLTSSFKRAGHKVVDIKSRAELPSALARTQFDVVLADLSDVKAIESQIGAATGRPALVPVLSNATAAQAEAASRDFGYLLKAPEKATVFLKTIDDLLSERLAARAARSAKIGRKN